MRTILGSAIVILVTFAAVAAPTFVHGPYSGAPTQDSVVISWLASEVVPARVEYAVQSEYEASGLLASWVDVDPTDSDTAQTEHVTLDSLDANTSFVYRVVLGGDEANQVSSLGRFVTEPAPGETVRFAVLADTQWQWEGENRLAAVSTAIAADEMPFDFILHAGDLVETPASTYWDHWFAAFAPMLLNAPFIPVLGNHERNHRTYYDHFNFPPGDGKYDERWWALHWGDVAIVGLDTDITRADHYIAQQDWARSHLSGTEPHKIVMFHYPVFSSDAYHGNGYSLDAIFHPIFVETGVDLVINGHAHNYERIVRDGITYLVVGGGGAVPRALAVDHVEGSQVAIEGYNFYLRVAAEPEGIFVDTISVAQATDDVFTLTDGHLLDSFRVGASDEDVLVERQMGPLLKALIAIVGVAAAVLLVLRLTQ